MLLDPLNMHYLSVIVLLILSCNPVYAATTTLHADLLCSEGNFSIEEVSKRQVLKKYEIENQTQWFNSEGHIQGVALLLHGVNMRANTMDPFAEVLSSSGIDVLRVTLYGHGGSPQEKRGVSRAEWLDELLEAYCIAKDRSEELGVPLYFVGYSLGALVNMDLTNGGFRQEIKYNKAVLFAPAVSLKKKVYKLRLILPLGYLFMPAKTRVFRALFDSYKHLLEEDLSLANAPTRVFMSPKDELISKDDLMTAVGIHNLTNWEFVDINNDKAEDKRPDHYLIVPEALGQERWDSMLNSMVEFLRQP